MLSDTHEARWKTITKSSARGRSGPKKDAPQKDSPFHQSKYASNHADSHRISPGVVTHAADRTASVTVLFIIHSLYQRNISELSYLFFF